MILLALIFVPVVVALVTLGLVGEEKRPARRWLLFLTSFFHAGGAFSLFYLRPLSVFSGFLAVDALGLLFLALTSLLFFLVAVYSFGYFYGKRRSDAGGGLSHFYIPCLLFFLASMTLCTLAQHLGLLWVAIETTTIASAPLIYYHNHARALEAAWKYLLICSVGIALALLGIFFVAQASRQTETPFLVNSLVAQASSLNPGWLRFGLILVLVGFGTKMGLAPFHTWLPDAHSEAPSPVSALLSGALLNCAFLGILRFHQIAAAAGLALFTGRLLTLFGLMSLFVAAVFMARQKNYKRLLAYSSIEHMGILSVGIGAGAGFAGLLHSVNHSLTKALLFLTAGKILGAYRTKEVTEVHGLLKTHPPTGILFLIGGLAIMGLPPFSPFVSEFFILREGLAQGHGFTMILYLLFLGFIFVAFSRILLGMVFGEKRDLQASGEKPSWPMILPAVVLAAGIIFLGLYLPPPMADFLKEAAGLFQEGL